MKRLIVIAAFVAAAAAAGCTGSSSGDGQKAVNEAATAASNLLRALATSAPGAAQDAFIVAQVTGKFATIDVDSVPHVAVRSHAGNVSLTGTVKNAGVASQFIAAAKAVRGVKRVDAKLQVDPKIPPVSGQMRDIELTAAVTASLAAEAGTNAFSVKPLVHDAVVTLVGTAPTPEIEKTMVQAARGTNGVRDVVDRISIRPR